MNFLLNKQIKSIIFLFLTFLLFMLSCKISEDYEILNKYYGVKYKGTITRMWTDDNRRPYFEVTPYNTSLYKKYVFCVTSEEYNKHIVGERVSLKKMVPKKDVVKEYVISDEENNLYSYLDIKAFLTAIVILGMLISFVALFFDDE